MVGQASRQSRDDRLEACPTKKEILPAGKRVGIGGLFKPFSVGPPARTDL